MKNKLIEILDKEKTDEIIPFLKALTEEDKKSIVPTIKSKIKAYTEDNPTHKHGSCRGSMNQFTIVSIAAFVCFNLNDYKRNRIQISYLTDGFIKFHKYTQKELMKQINIDDILEWYCPEWIDQYVNDPRLNEDYKCADYLQLLRWHYKGYISLSPELVVATLSRCIFESYYDKGRYHSFHPERLLEYDITLKEHIWLFFEYPTDICYNIYYGNDKNKDANWTSILIDLSNNGKIDRIRMLKQTLLTWNKDFNKVLIGWFVDLFNEAKPTEDELLTLQFELFSTFNSPQTKVVNNALNHIKTIYANDDFQTKDFLNFISPLITSPTKGIVSSTLDICDKILKKKNEDRDEICIALCNGFVSKDESIQKKLGKLLAKYADKNLLKDYLNLYAGNILISVQQLMKDIYDFEDIIPEEAYIPESNQETEKLGSIREDNLIKQISSFDDYIFFLNQAFDNNQIHDLLLLPVYIQRYHHQISKDNLHQLEPALKRATQNAYSWSNNIGLTGTLFITFFIHYIEYLDSLFPDSSPNIKKLIEEKRYINFINWRSKIMHSENYPYYYILLKVFDCIKKGEKMELISTPTHSPLWIDPMVLVERVAKYQSENKLPYIYDIQFALQQCALDNTEKALELAKTKLNGELRELIVYLLDKETEAKVDVEHPHWWMTASMVKSPNTIPKHIKEWKFSHIPNEYLSGMFKWEMKKNKDDLVQLEIDTPLYNEVYKKDQEKCLVSEFIFGRLKSKMVMEGDVRLMMCSAPYNHDSFTIHILNQVTDSSKKDSFLNLTLINALTSLLDINMPLTTMDRLLLNICLLWSDKTIRNFASELWISSVFQGNVDSEVLGMELGKIIEYKWAPIKRLIELIESNILNISRKTNIALEKLMIGILSEIDSSISNLKKLLEIYYELLHLNSSKVDRLVISKINSWEGVSSMKKIIKQINEKQ